MGEPLQAKRFLILEECRYRYQAALSDIAGMDIEFHGADARTAVRKVRNWLVGEAALQADGGDRIFSRYTDFSGWYVEDQLARGFSGADIADYNTPELLAHMRRWLGLGQPTEAT
jgi:hypothetical protein